jgi:hypothetical protein
MISTSSSQDPRLSVVIAIVSDAVHLQGCLQALYQQIEPPTMEIIVPYHAEDQDVPRLQSQFPEVRFHRVETLRSVVHNDGASREHHDELRARGLGLARGEVVALIEDHGRADKYWARNVMLAHKETHAAIGGAIENEVDRPLNWAVYYCDFGRYQNPVNNGPTPYISDANISYKRPVLSRHEEIWKDSFHETTVNGILMAQGEELWLSSDIVVHQHRENLSLSRALTERYVWGRSYAGTRAQETSFFKRLVYLALSPALPILLMARKIRDVLTRKRLVGKFLYAFPLTFLLTVSWSVGEFMGYLTGRQNKFVRS